MPTLLVLRHAQAQTFAAADHDRALTGDGARAAQAVGRVIAATGVPDRTLVSSARRARETLEAARSAGGWDTATVALDALYGAAPADVLDALATHADGSEIALVVGHEPWCSALIEALTGARVGMAAAAIANVQVGPAWDDLDPSWCALRWLLPPWLAASTGQVGVD